MIEQLRSKSDRRTGGRRRHGDDHGAGGALPRLSGVERPLEPAHPGRAGRRASRTQRDISLPGEGSSWSCGCPSCAGFPEGQSVALGSFSPSHLIFDEFDVAAQACTSHHYRHREDGTVEYGSGRFRYAWPAELDLMARLAGMRLESRYADWSRAPFDSESSSHVSIWTKG